MKRRQLLAGLAALAGTIAWVRVDSRADGRAPEVALERLLDAMYPGAPDLPGARATALASRIGPRLEAPSAPRAAIVRALAEVEHAAVIDDAALVRLLGGHPDAMRWLVNESCAVLYGSRRHDGVGENGAFAGLGYPG